MHLPNLSLAQFLAACTKSRPGGVKWVPISGTRCGGFRRKHEQNLEFQPVFCP